MSQPSISIVLPVYNGEEYLRASIDSVLSQDMEGWELIIIDDGSTDDSAKISKEYVAKDQRISFYQNEKNLNLPRALNRGFECAKGELLTWHSDDNIMLPHYLSLLKGYLDQHPDIDFVYADYQRIDGGDRKLSRVWQRPPEFLPARNYVGASFMYRRKLLETVGGYDETMFLIED